MVLPFTPNPSLSRSEISNDYDSTNITPGSGTNFDATVATSGFDSSGPWYIETQSLDVDYVRMPTTADRYGITQNIDYALSGSWPRYNGVSGVHQRCELVCRVYATVKVVKSNDPFTTSAYSQPQIFTVQAFNTDLNGVVYGGTGVSGVDVSGRLGLRGNLVTSQEFYNRRPWNAAEDAAKDESVDGAYNFFAEDSGVSGWNQLNEARCMSDYRSWAVGAGLDECGPPGPYRTVDRNKIMHLLDPGQLATSFPYTPSNETMKSDKKLALWAGHRARMGWLYKTEYCEGVIGTGNTFGQAAGAGVYTPSYDVNRHSWN